VKYLTEFRNGEIAQRMAREIHSVATRPWKIMEVCGGQTHSIIKNGIDQMLPAGIEMIHGPGCPVCVTPLELIDKALAIARTARRDLLLLRRYAARSRHRGRFISGQRRGRRRARGLLASGCGRTGRQESRQAGGFLRRGLRDHSSGQRDERSRGQTARPQEFLAAGFARSGAACDSAILDSPGNQVQGFLLAGHVCSVMGYWEYPPLAAKYKVPLVVTGFEPLDLLDGIRRAVIQLEAGRYEVENAYERIVTFEGNKPAQKLLTEVFEVTDRAWRGIGVIPKSGWRLSADYRDFDAEERFQISGIHTEESPLCHSGDVLRGVIKPAQCPAFGKECTPRHPLARPWFQAKALARPITTTGGTSAPSNWRRRVQPTTSG